MHLTDLLHEIAKKEKMYHVAMSTSYCTYIKLGGRVLQLCGRSHHGPLDLPFLSSHINLPDLVHGQPTLFACVKKEKKAHPPN